MNLFGRPRGIASRVLLGLILLSLGTLVVCILAIYSFREAGQKMDEVTANLLPLVSVSAELGTEGINLGNRAIEITTASSHIELGTVGFELSDQIALIDRIKTKLVALGAAPETLKQFIGIETNLITDSNHLVDLVKQRIDQQQEISLLVDGLNQMVSHFNRPLTELLPKQNRVLEHDMDVQNNLQQWKKLSLSTALTALNSSSTLYQTALNKQRQEVAELWHERSLTQQQLIAVMPELEARIQILDSKWNTPDEVLNLRVDLLKTNSAIQGALDHHRLLSDQLAEFVGDYAFQIQQHASKLSTLIKDELSSRTKLLTLAFTLALVVAAMVFMYVDHYVVSRVQALNQKIRGYSKDLTESNQWRRKDEIEEIENSFAYFATSIERREAKLQELSDIAQFERDKAESANRSKTRLLNAASHDLRQPLHAMTLLLASLRHQISNEKGVKLHDALESSIYELSQSFDTILNLSGIDGEEMAHNMGHFCLSNVLTRIEIEFKLAADKAGSGLNVTPSNFVAFSNAEAVYRIISNLLSNAIRYAPNSDINLFVTEDNNHLEIRVSDTGIGIDHQSKEKVFEDSYRLSDMEGGTGMGLAIAQELAQLIESKVYLKDNVPHGAIFYFRIQKGNQAFVDTSKVDIPKLEVPSLMGLPVVVVDDDISVVQSTQWLLESWGCRVRCYQDGERAAKASRSFEKNTVLLTDLHLGRSENGLKIAQQISEKMQVTLSVVIISADKSNETRASIKNRGYAFIRKPIKPAQLATILRGLT